MTKFLPTLCAVLFSLCSLSTALAETITNHLSKDEAVQILSTLERLNARHYKIVHIADGTLRDKDGFEHDHAKKITYFGPQNQSNTVPTLLHVTMLYSSEYGWYLQRTAEDNRGLFLEISSQKQGRVFVR